jgi:Flp pilus assembly protein TadB
MSHALMENQRLERKMDSETAAGRSVIQILSAFPSVFVVLFYYLAPDMVKLLLWEPKGQIAIVVAAFLNYCSVKMALKYMSVRI